MTKKPQSITRIEIISKIIDARATVRKNKFADFGFGKQIKEILISDVYTISKNFSPNEAYKIADMVTNPVTQQFRIITKPYIHDRIKKNFQKFSWVIEVGFLPGVTDNLANTVREIIEDALNISFTVDEGVFSSQITYIEGKLNEKEIVSLAENLHNPLIHRVHIKRMNQYLKQGGMDFITPKVLLQKKPEVTIIDLKVPDDELIIIGKQGIQNKDGTRRGPLALDLTYMKAIQNYFKKLGRNPTDVELESIAQTWSEHCKHTIFSDPVDDVKDGLYKTYIKKATEKIRNEKHIKNDICISVFTDNSGAIAFDEEHLITHKVETHNSPSALDPFGGAITGILGVNRDALGFGLGALPIINTYGFCFGNPDNKSVLYKGLDLTQKMLSSRRILDGVVQGINSGGNCTGIPSPQGFLYFDNRYRAKPLVFAGTVGLIPRRINGKLSHIKKAEKGDCIVIVGGRVGKDGIHGATFSSEALDSGSPVSSVQIGDPITQKKLSDAIIKEGRDLGLYSSITDNGAGGLSCSVAEMAKESGGCKVYLDKIPLKYPGLDPWEIWVSESQERMTLAIPEKNVKKFVDLMKRRSVESTVIGNFTDSGKCTVVYKEDTVMDIDLEFLHNGLPKRPMKSLPKEIHFQEPVIPKVKNFTKLFLDMLTRPNISSYSFISEQYDHIVQGRMVLYPLQGKGNINGDVTISRPLLNAKKAVMLSQALFPSYSDIDPYAMAACCIDSAVRNLVAAGASPENIALLDNFCWCSGNDPYRLWQLKKAAQACYDYATLFGTPFISGKDSMFNDFRGYDKFNEPVYISIPPTLLISSITVLKNCENAVSLDAKFPGDLVYILGETFDETGGSEYFNMLSDREKKKYISNKVPKVNGLINIKLYKDFHKAIEEKLIASAQSVNRGGLGVALAKIAMGGMLGIQISLKDIPGKVNREDVALFSESQGRLIVTIAPENKKKFEKVLKGNSFFQIGTVTKNPSLIISGFNGNVIVKTNIETAIEKYKDTFRSF